MGMFSSIIIALVVVVLGYSIFAAVKNAGSGRITLQLDEVYSNTNEMACAALEELKKQGRECEIVEIGKGYPKLLVDGRKYVLTYRMSAVCGVPMQVIQLKMCRE